MHKNKYSKRKKKNKGGKRDGSAEKAAFVQTEGWLVKGGVSMSGKNVQAEAGVKWHI